jgi:hypothetical protein
MRRLHQWRDEADRGQRGEAAGAVKKLLKLFAGSNDAGGASNCWSATGGGSKTSGCDSGNAHPVKLAVTTTTSHAIFNKTFLILHDHLQPNAGPYLNKFKGV